MPSEKLIVEEAAEDTSSVRGFSVLTHVEALQVVELVVEDST